MGNKRPKSQRGLGKPTGFEEYYADGPLTPAEHAEMCKLYNRSRAFIDRFEDALMRFQHKRRILPDRLHVFHKYLQYGGVSIGPNYGTGVTAKEVKGMTTDQAMQARTQTAVENSRKYLDISFNEVVKGFLSYYVGHFNPDNRASIDLATVTIKNFYTYLLYHDVCPEYNDDIEEARKSCDLATEELWKNMQLVHNAPGAFNRSCSALFGGYHFGSTWKDTEDIKGSEAAHQIARKVVKYAIAGAGSNKQASRFKDLADQDSLSAMKVEDIDGFEIIEVMETDNATRDFYREYAPDLIPVGKIRAKSYRDPSNPDIDMFPEERAEWDKGNGPAYDFEFFLEPDLLAFCYPGLKVITGVWELNCGVYYIDEIMSTYPSFYTVIANDLMLNWRWPKDLTKKDGKQQVLSDYLPRSEPEKLFLKDIDSKDTNDNAIVGTEKTCEILKMCQEATGLPNLTLVATKKMEIVGKTGTGPEDSDLEDDEKLEL